MTHLRRLPVAVLIVLINYVADVFGAQPTIPDVLHPPEVEEVKSFDHLFPVDRSVPEFRYVAQYWAEPQYAPQRYAVVILDESSQRCYIQVGEAPAAQRTLDRPYVFKDRAEISTSTANVIYRLWMHVLLRTRYDRRGSAVIVTNATKYTYSTFMPGLGWMHGSTWTAPEPNPPLNLINDAAEMLLAFVANPKRDETLLRKGLEKDLREVSAYLQKHD